MQAEKIFYLLKNIESDTKTIDSRFHLTLKSIAEHIEVSPYLREMIVTQFEERRKTIYLRYFEVEIEVQSKIKIFEFEETSTPNYCDEISFSIFHGRYKENETILKVYITYDGFIVSEPSKPGSICETTNSYKGRKILDLLFEALYEKKIITA